MESRLIEAAGRGDIPIVRKLLRKNVDPNYKDETGFTAVSKAAAAGHNEVVRLLLEAKGNPNSYDGVLTTPLHLAAAGHHSETVKHLLLANGQAKQKNLDGWEPIDFAAHNTETWQILHNAKQGEMPELEERNEMPFVPDYSIPGAKPKKEKGKKGKGKKKGKKGAKKGKKKGKGKKKKKK